MLTSKLLTSRWFAIVLAIATVIGIGWLTVDGWIRRFRRNDGN